MIPGDVSRLIAAANATCDARAQSELESRFAVSRTLAVYGTLAPGRSNHHVVAPLGGVWKVGVIVGDLSDDGWGATGGYPGYRPREGGDVIESHVLVSDALPAAWPRLDAFEGPEYRRILVPVFRCYAPADIELLTVANVYVVATG